MKAIVKLCVTAAILAWLFHIVPFAAILDALLSAQPGYLAGGLALQMLMRVPAATRMKIIADAQDLGLCFTTILGTLFTTSFYGLLLPGGMAGGAATWMKFVQHGVRGGAAFASIVVNRATDMLTILFAGSAYWIVDRYLAGPAAAAFLGLAVAMLFALQLLLFKRAHYLSVALEYGARLRWLRNSASYAHVRAVGADVALLREMRMRQIMTLTAVCLAQDLIAINALYCFAQSLDIDLGFITVAWMRVAVQLVVLLPISLAGLGVREGTLVYLTAAFGVAAPAAVAWSFLIFGGTLLAALIGGLIEMRHLWTTQRQS